MATNTNNPMLSLLGQSIDTILISALFDTSFACNSIKNIFLSALKAIGKLGMILVIKSLFSGESFKIENLFQKLIRIIFYKKMVLVDQKVTLGEEKFERTYEGDYQRFLINFGYVEHSDIYNNKENCRLPPSHEQKEVSYLHFITAHFNNKVMMLEEEKKLKEYEQKMKNKITKKYQRKREKEFQDFLKRNFFEENIDYNYAKCNIGVQLFNGKYISYLNYVNTNWGQDEMLEEEKKIQNNISTGENFNEDYNFFLNIKAIFDKKEEPKEPFPVYLTKNGNYTLEYLPYFHNTFIEGVKKRVHQDYIESKNIPLGQTKCYRMAKLLSNGFTSYTPKKLFPSKNYKKLTDMISNYFEICKMTENYEPLCVLINGKPGLGKSHFIEYISSTSTNVCDNSIKIDMTEQTANSLETIINETFASNNMGQGNTVILIDELDKYIDQYIKKNAKSYKMEDKVTGKPPMEITTTEKIQLTEEEQKTQKLTIKEDFLYSLLRVAEYDQFTHPVVILFVANNFDTIYDGVEMTHFQSLKSRFSEVQFESCDKPEIIDYLKYLNNTFFLNTKYYENDINNLITQIPDKIDIVYRDLKQISFRANFQIKEIIESLKNLGNKNLLENKN